MCANLDHQMDIGTSATLLNTQDSCLLIVDMQERLIPAIHEHETLVASCAWLVKVAGVVGVPLLVSEQYPKGLGATVSELRELIRPDAFMEKVHFSCGASPSCRTRIEMQQVQQVVIAGIEAHVCVLQSAIDLLHEGKSVYVVADAISSRRARDVELAITRMRQVGVQIISKEMALFEWAHQAGTDQFRTLNANYLR